MYCFLSEELAVSIYMDTNYISHKTLKEKKGQHTIILILIRRFTASMNTSNSSTNHINNDLFNFGL